MKGVGRIYQQTFIDTYAKVVFAKLYDRKTPITAAEILNDRVLPFFEEHGIALCRVLTDRGTEYCGNPEHHDYELYLAVLVLIRAGGGGRRCRRWCRRLLVRAALPDAGASQPWFGAPPRHRTAFLLPPVRRSKVEELSARLPWVAAIDPVLRCSRRRN
jgi:hypothetical protein